MSIALRMKPGLAAWIAVASVVGHAPAAGPPPETAARLGDALRALDANFVGAYTLTSRTVVEKPNGTDRKESLRVVSVTRRAGGTVQKRIVKALENGKDVTAEEQAEAAKEEQAEAAKNTPATSSKTPGNGTEGDGGGKKKHELRAALKLPTSGDAKLYRFGPPTDQDGFVLVAFEPLPEHRKEDGMAQGRLAWRRDTLDPAWLEAELISTPTGVSEFFMRFEFLRQGDALYPAVTVIKGRGGILWIKRRFDNRTEITDFAPAPMPGPSSASPGR